MYLQGSRTNRKRGRGDARTLARSLNSRGRECARTPCVRTVATVQNRMATGPSIAGHDSAAKATRAISMPVCKAVAKTTEIRSVRPGHRPRQSTRPHKRLGLAEFVRRRAQRGFSPGEEVCMLLSQALDAVGLGHPRMLASSSSRWLGFDLAASRRVRVCDSGGQARRFWKPHGRARGSARDRKLLGSHTRSFTRICVPAGGSTPRSRAGRRASDYTMCKPATEVKWPRQRSTFSGTTWLFTEASNAGSGWPSAEDDLVPAAMWSSRQRNRKSSRIALEPPAGG